MEKYLSRPEEMVLLTVWKLGANAYGVTIREHLQKITGKYWSIGAIYVPLERLEKKGYLKSHQSQPSPERGGRRKRIFQMTPHGQSALDQLYELQSELWQGYGAISVQERKGD